MNELMILLIVLGFGLFFLIGYVYGTPSAEERERTLLKKKDIEKIIKEYLKNHEISINYKYGDKE